MSKNQMLNEFYSDAEISHLTNLASTAEKQGTLTDSQMKVLVQKNFHKLFVPKKYNGLEKKICLMHYPSSKKRPIGMEVLKL